MNGSTQTARRRARRFRIAGAVVALSVIAFLLAAVPASPPVSAVPTAATAAGGPAQGGFVGVTPFRVMDTRNPLSSQYGCLDQALARRVIVAGVLGSPVPAGVAAVALNVTAISPSAAGYLTVYPAAVPRPTASSLNYVAGQVIPNNVIVKVGYLDAVDIYASGGCPNAIVDVVGYFLSGSAAAGGFTGVTPYRVVDTRSTGGCVQQVAPRRIQIGGVGGSNVPAGVAAVALNVTVVQPSLPGFLTVFPAGVTRPTASTLNYVAGQVIPNGTVVKLGTSDAIDVYASGGCPNVIVDVVGYFAAGTPTEGGTFAGVTPYRLLDSRTAGGCVQQAGPRRLQVAGVAGSNVPAGVSAVALNVTVVQPSLPGFLTVYPAGVTRPTASTLNFVAGDVIPNGALVKVGTSDSIDIYASGGCPNVIVDVVGYFLANQTLTVTKPGNGTGVVTSSPSGINCGSTCVETFTTDSTVTLSAAADSGSTFVGWSGGGCAGTGTCQVTMSSATTVQANFSYDSSKVITNLTGGYTHSCAVRVDGSAKCWGENRFGDLGDGTSTGSAFPVNVSGMSTASAIAVGGSHSCALLTGGTVQCWGYDGYGQVGVPSFGSDFLTPSTVAGVSNALQVAAGPNHSCALVTGGTVKCWGRNDSGQLGNGTTTSSPSPVTVTGISTATAISAGGGGGGTTCALLADHSVRCWGENESGQLGNGTTTDSSVPVTVSGITDAAQVSVGRAGSNEGHACAVLNDHSVRCWGRNATGQLGNGTTTSSSVPVAVTGISNAQQVVALGYSSCALLTDHSVRCWGQNSAGQLGDGTTTNSTAPVAVTGISTATAISGGGYTACALLADGTARCWGYNIFGQLGNGTTVDSSVPVTVVRI